jgi:RNA polymerase-binding protein DksA
MKTTEEIRTQLIARHTELGGRIGRITKHVRHTDNPLSADFAEQAVERENDEVLTALDGSIRTELAQIEQALARLDDGIYGICETCGNPIGEKRIAALPYALTCIACAT